MEYVLKTHSLTKSFNGVEAVSDIGMKVKKGEIYGFLGPNGAGKTTVLKLISNLLKPTCGEIELFGEKLTPTGYNVLKRMGSIIETPVFYEKLTARENMSLHCEYMGYHDKDAIEKALSLLEIEHTDKKPVRDFSLGMKQRLGIARAIVTKPEFIILDEPINGLDPVGIKSIRDLIKTLNKDYEMTFLISSHILGEMEQLAQTIGIISGGKLVKEISMDTVREETLEYIELRTDNTQAAAYVLDHELRLSNFKVMDHSLIRVYHPQITQSQIIKAMVSNDVGIESINSVKSTLEEYFIRLINGNEHSNKEGSR